MIKKAISDGRELIIKIEVPHDGNVFDAVRSALEEMDRSEPSFRANAEEGGRPDPRANVKDPDYVPSYKQNLFEKTAMRPSDIAEFSPKCEYVTDFGGALNALRRGEHVARKGWNGKGIFIALQRPDSHSKMTSPYIYIDTTGLRTENPDAPKSCVPWLASQTDMLAEDWVVLD